MSAIDLNDEPFLRGRKIHDRLSKRNLPAKLGPELSAANRFRQPSLGFAKIEAHEPSTGVDQRRAMSGLGVASFQGDLLSPAERPGAAFFGARSVTRARRAGSPSETRGAERAPPAKPGRSAGRSRRVSSSGPQRHSWCAQSAQRTERERLPTILTTGRGVAGREGSPARLPHPRAADRPQERAQAAMKLIGFKTSRQVAAEHATRTAVSTGKGETARPEAAPMLSLLRRSSTEDARVRGTQDRSYAYNDPGGNITSKSDLGSYTYHPSRPNAVATAGDNSYQYDNNGNQKHREGPGIAGGVQDITHTAFNLPRTITTGTGAASSVTEFDYDAMEQRVAKRGSLTTTHYAGDGYQRSRPASGTGPRDHRYVIYGPTGPVAQLARTEDGTTVSPLAVQYVHGDALGSAHTVSDPTGQTRFQNFPPFAAADNELFTQSGITGGFTGHEHDGELGLVNMRGRIYDPALARFLTPDPFVQAPLWTQGLNRYSYTWNNPLKYVDPSGFAASDDWQDYIGPIGLGLGAVGLVTYGGLVATGKAGEFGFSSLTSPGGYGGGGGGPGGAISQVTFSIASYEYLSNSPSFNQQSWSGSGGYATPTGAIAKGGSVAAGSAVSEKTVTGWAPVAENAKSSPVLGNPKEMGKRLVPAVANVAKQGARRAVGRLQTAGRWFVREGQKSIDAYKYYGGKAWDWVAGTPGARGTIGAAELLTPAGGRQALAQLTQWTTGGRGLAGQQANLARTAELIKQLPDESIRFEPVG
jgi:RHS repeat-associated protein